MNERALELQIGLFAVVALAAVGALWLALRGWPGGGSSYLVDFSASAGLAPGAPVELAGVSVGRVEAVDLLPVRRDDRGAPLPVRVRIRVDERAVPALVQDSRFAISMPNPLGEPLLEIVPGSPGAAPLPPGSERRGEDPPRFDRLMTEAERLLGKLSDAAESEPGNFRSLLRHLDAFVSDADGALRATQPEVATALADVSSAAVEARRLADEARPLLAELRESVPPAARHAAAVAARLDAVTQSLGPEDGRRIQASLSGLEAELVSLREATGRAEAILGRIDRGDGTLGRSINDPKLYEDLRALVSDLRAHPWKLLWK